MVEDITIEKYNWCESISGCTFMSNEFWVG